MLGTGLIAQWENGQIGRCKVERSHEKTLKGAVAALRGLPNPPVRARVETVTEASQKKRCLKQDLKGE